jgi:hypothetical protein
MRRWPGILAVLLGVAGCAGGVDAPPAPSPAGLKAAPGGRAEDFLVVDCLLPGQIRQLGGRVTYVTARRAVKTSGRDCELRGGEYVAYDRATRAAALRVWTPLAEQGDVEAQINVAEIYERGLDAPPDYAAAAQWYRRAAEKGSARAATSLGALYERGLGVPRDPTQALSWYRRAAPGLTFTIDESAEMQRLRQENERLRQQLDVKQKDLDKTQKELEELRRGLEQRRRETDQEKDALARLRRELEESRKREQAAQAGLRDLERAIREREGGVAAKDQEAAALRAEIARLQQERAQRERSADQGVQQLRQAIAEREAQLRARDKEAAELRASLTQLRDDRARREQAAATARDLERQIAERESRLAAREREVGELRATVARLESASAAQRAELDRLKKQAAEAPPDIQLLEPELVAFRSLELRAARLPAARTELLMVGRVTGGVEIATFTINGREHKLEADRMFKASVAVKGGEERIRLVAIDRGGRKATLEFVALDASRAAAASLPERVGLPRARDLNLGSYHALVIGNNDYRYLRRLRTAVNDATVIARILEQDYGFKVTLLLNGDRYQTLSALNTLRETLTEKDNLLVYYAGHGELDQLNQRGHWLPVDAEPGNTANWISTVTITDILNAMTVRQLLVVADSCYSGTLTRSAVGQLPGGLSDEERAKLLRRMIEKRSRLALTSGGTEPVLDSLGGPHSVFAQHFIELLRSNSGVLLGQEMFRHLQGRVTAAVQRRTDQTAQLPEYAPIKAAGHESGDFVFARVAAAR